MCNVHSVFASREHNDNKIIQRHVRVPRVKDYSCPYKNL